MAAVGGMKLRALRWLAPVAILAAAPSSYALDPHRATSQYVLTKWGAASLGSNAVHALAQTRDRYLWLGTSAGLVRFDGARFTVVNSRNTPDFGDGGVWSLAPGPDDSVFFGTASGAVLRYRDAAFERLPVSQGTGPVFALAQRQDGSLWISMHGRPLHRWSGDKVQSLIDQLSDIAPPVIVEDARGVVWIGTRNAGLVRYEAGRFEHIGVTHDSILALYADRGGALWIGTPHGLLKLTAGRIVARFTHREGLSHDSVSAIREDRDGNLWIGTAGGGLNRLSNGKITRFTTQEGLSDDDVRSLFEDHEGNLWVGTADGLNCLSEGRFTTYGRLEALRDPAVASVVGGADGTIWMGTKSRSVLRLRDGVLDQWPLPGGVGRESITTLYEAHDRSLWIGLENGRLFHLKGQAITEATPLEGQPTWKYPVIVEDERGPMIYITGLNGFARIVDRRVVSLGDHPLGAAAPRVGYPHLALRTPDGTLWIGGSQGLARLRDGTWKRFTRADGLPHDRVRSISAEPDGSLWLATGLGLAYFKDGVFHKITVREGLPENYLRLVLDDGLGHLWIASMGSIFRLDKRELLELMAGTIDRVSPILFDISDGLRTTEGLLSNAPGFRASDGRLWFATAKGVSVVDPRRIDTGAPAPEVRIEGVSVDGPMSPRRAGDVARAEYSPGRGEVTIEYAALSFGSPSKVRFRHQLEGLDEGWVDAGARRTAYYSTLPPGSYRFRVMACNRDGVWNGQAATLAFSIRPPFYRTPWFYAACLAGVAALVAAGHRVRVNQMRARFAAIIDERTRIARELHDTLAQGLAAVGIQLDTAMNRLPAEPGLSKVQRHMQLAQSMVRSSLAEVRRSIWVLRAQTSKATNGLSLSLHDNLAQLTADSGVASTLHVSGEARPLPSEIERSLLRIAHEAVTNAIRHAGAKNVIVDLHFDADRVHLRVKDDGCGFDPEAARDKTRGKNFGLVGIAERARAMGGQLKLESQPGVGTAIECHLPYECRVETANTEGIEGVSL
jgi:signal transduction histidine kinase/ligand-binding sensor domain-containing protein